MPTRNITLEEDVFADLKQFAEPLVDDINSVIRKLIDSYLQKTGATLSPTPSKQKVGGVMEFDPASPPNLRYTTPTKITLDGKLFKPTETYWNTLLIEVIRRAAGLVSEKNVPDLVIVNHQIGKKTDTGFKFIPEANVSVQGQDSVMAWKAIHHVAAQLGIPVEVEFRWQSKAMAAYPGGRARMRVN
jgi:hypothetical protein